LLNTRLKEIHERDYPFATVECGPMSKLIVAKHGFKQLTTVWDYEWEEK
jgi:predicted acetyltransferase